MKTRHIRLTHASGRQEIVAEPEGFEWKPREGTGDNAAPPLALRYQDKDFELKGVYDHCPYYTEKGADLPPFQGSTRTNGHIKPGDAFRWKTGPWAVGRVFPAPNDGRCRQLVEISNPAGESEWVDDVFIERWMRPRQEPPELTVIQLRSDESNREAQNSRTGENNG